MEEFISTIVSVVGGIFNAIIEALKSLGGLIFTLGETGAITGVTGFGYVLAVVLGIPLATWLFSLGFGFIKRMLKQH